MSAFRVFKRFRSKKANKDTAGVSDYTNRDPHLASQLDIGTTDIRWITGQKATDNTWRPKAVLLVGHDLIVVGSNQKSQNSADRLYIYDIYTKKWSGADLHGQPPAVSDFYSSESSAMQDKIFVFWATQSLRVSVLNFVANLQWDQPDTSSGDAPPTVVTGYTTTRVGSKIYLFGGANLVGEQSNQIYSFHTDHYEWKHIKSQKEIPRPRVGHSSTVIDEHRILIFGGKSGLDYLNDGFIFDTRTNTFEKVIFGGPLPVPRAFHSATVHTSKRDGKRVMILIGGHDGGYLYNDVSVLDLDTMIWFKVHAFGDAPSGRFSQYSASVGSTVLNFGGQDNKDFFFDISFLKLENIARKSVSTPDLSSKHINNATEEEKSTELGQHIQHQQSPPTKPSTNQPPVESSPKVSNNGTAKLTDPLLEDNKGLMDYLAQYTDDDITPDFSPSRTTTMQQHAVTAPPKQNSPSGATTTAPSTTTTTVVKDQTEEVESTVTVASSTQPQASSSSRVAESQTLQSQTIVEKQSKSQTESITVSQTSTQPNPENRSTDAADSQQNDALPVGRPSNLFVDTSRDHSPKPSPRHASKNPDTDMHTAPQNGNDSHNSGRNTPLSTTPTHRAPVRRVPSLAKMERQHSFTNKHILNLLQNTPTTPSERSQSPLGKVGGTVASMQSQQARSPSRTYSRRGSLSGVSRLGSPVPRSSTPIHFYGESTPPRSGTPITVVEDDEDQAAQLQETFGDLSRLVAERKMSHSHAPDVSNSKPKQRDNGISQKTQDVESGAAFEFNVSFGSFNFGAANKKSPSVSRKSVSTRTTSTSEKSSLAEFCNTEAETIRNVYEYLCNPDEIEEEYVESDGLLVADFLRVCKFCFMLENGISYIDVMNWLSEIMGTQIQSNDEISHEVFRKILLRIAVKKYRNTSESSIVCFHHLVEKKLLPNYKQALHLEDEQLDYVLTPQSIQLMAEYDSKLKELFSLFSTLGLSSAHHPSWTTILKNHSAISLPEMLQMAHNFDIIPYLIPRHLFSKLVQKASTRRRAVASKAAQQHQNEKGLNYPEFVEGLFRVALYIYSKYPYSTMFKTTQSKLHALLDAMGLNDRKKFNLFMKSAGVSVRNKYKYRAASKKISKKRLDEILQDADSLRAELAHIFMYYCAFGDPLNLEKMSSAKFSKFVKDIRIEKHVNKEAAELIYVKMMKNRALRVGDEVDQEHHKMTFPYFMEALKVIAHRVYPKSHPKEALYRLLREHVLAYASKEPRKFEHVNSLDRNTQELFTKHKKNLLALFHSYCTRDTVDSHNFGYMTIEAFVKFATQFDITPTLVHKKDLYRIFRSSLLNTTAKDIDYQQFEDCIAKVAYLAYSKHPYDVKYKTLDQKIGGIFEKIGLYDWVTLRKILEKFGHKVPYSPAKAYKNSTSINISGQQTSLNDLDLEEEELVDDYLELPPEEELDYELRCIFTYYSEFGNRYGKQHLGNQQYIRFCKDSLLYDTGFGQVDVDLVYVEVTKNEQQHITYELFCDSLTVLAERKYSDMTTTDALRRLLLHNVLPHAQRKHIKEAIDQEQVCQDALQVVLHNEIPLQKIFDAYKKLELIKGSSGLEMQEKDRELSIAELLHFTQDFDICPELLSVSEVSDLFKVSLEQDAYVEDDVGLGFDQFLECVARIAVRAYSKRHFLNIYHDNVQRTEALMERMDVHSAIRLTSKLRTLSAHSVVTEKK